MSKKTEKQVLKFNDVCYFEGYFYFSSNQFNGLFRWKKGDKKPEFLCMFEKELTLQDNMHSHILVHDRKLYFIPFNGSKISVYDGKAGRPWLFMPPASELAAAQESSQI